MSVPHFPASGPYPPTTASLGGLPTVGVDVPLCAVFLVLYIIGAVSHMTILQVNLRRGHKFVISGLLFGFCMSRLVTMILRIVWATRPTNLRLGIASNVFVYAGVRPPLCRQFNLRSTDCESMAPIYRMASTFPSHIYSPLQPHDTLPLHAYYSCNSKLLHPQR